MEINFQPFEQNNVNLEFEAAVWGVPTIRSLKEV